MADQTLFICLSGSDQHITLLSTFIQVKFLLCLLLLLMSLVWLLLNFVSTTRPGTYKDQQTKVKEQQQQQKQHDSEEALVTVDSSWAQDDGRLIQVIQESFLHRPPPSGPLRLTQVTTHDGILCK